MYLAEELGARVYFPHISSRKALDVIRFWRSRFKDVIVETCPHYLTHTEDSDLGGMGKANPPFRTKDDLEAIWEAIFDGTVDLVASDHNARKKVNKDKPLWLASQGFPATASMLPVMLSEGYHKRKLPLQRICQLLGSMPAKVFDLAPLKGSLAPGADAGGCQHSQADRMGHRGDRQAAARAGAQARGDHPLRRHRRHGRRLARNAGLPSARGAAAHLVGQAGSHRARQRRAAR